MASAIMANAAELTAKENTIVDIGAAVARGEQDKLGAAFKAGFDAGLTLNEAKERSTRRRSSSDSSTPTAGFLAHSTRLERCSA